MTVLKLRCRKYQREHKFYKSDFSVNLTRSFLDGPQPIFELAFQFVSSNEKKFVCQQQLCGATSAFTTTAVVVVVVVVVVVSVTTTHN